MMSELEALKNQLKTITAERDKLKAYLLSRQGLDLPILLGYEAALDSARQEVAQELAAKDAEIERLKSALSSKEES